MQKLNFQFTSPTQKLIFVQVESPLRTSDVFPLHQKVSNPYLRSHLTQYDLHPTHAGNLTVDSLSL